MQFEICLPYSLWKKLNLIFSPCPDNNSHSSLHRLAWFFMQDRKYQTVWRPENCIMKLHIHETAKHSQVTAILPSHHWYTHQVFCFCFFALNKTAQTNMRSKLPSKYVQSATATNEVIKGLKMISIVKRHKITASRVKGREEILKSKTLFII